MSYNVFWEVFIGEQERLKTWSRGQSTVEDVHRSTEEDSVLPTWDVIKDGTPTKTLSKTGHLLFFMDKGQMDNEFSEQTVSQVK